MSPIPPRADDLLVLVGRLYAENEYLSRQVAHLAAWQANAGDALAAKERELADLRESHAAQVERLKDQIELLERPAPRS